MELKVWMDDIQRVVCGVSELTTCRDVVYALAHATGRTGRFTLVERWRGNERLLAPQERPVKVLGKWGQHCGEVQFVLLRSPLTDKSPSGRRLARQRLGAARPLSPDPPPCSSQQSSVAAITSPQQQQQQQLCVVGEQQQQLCVVPALGGTRLADHVLRGTVGVVRGVPQQQQQQQHAGRSTVNSLPFVAGVSVPVRHQSPVKTAPVRSAPSPCLNDSVSSTNSVSWSSQDGTCALSRASAPSSAASSRRFDTPPPYRQPPPPPVLPTTSSAANRAAPPPYRQPPPPPPTAAAAAASPLPRSSSSSSCSTKDQDGDTGGDSVARAAVATDDQVRSCDRERAELLATVRSQRQRLHSLQSHTQRVDGEAELFERMQRDYEVQIVALQTETTQLERVLLQRQSELSLAEADEEACGRERELGEHYQQQLSTLQLQLKQCSEQLDCTNKTLSELSETLPVERRASDAQQAALCDQLLELARQLRQLQHQQNSLVDQRAAGQLQLQQLEQLMEQRQQQLRQLNLEALSLSSLSPPLADPSAGEAGRKRAAVVRQLVGSARQLELAVPTTRNPLGVWV